MNQNELIESWKREEEQPFTGWDFSYLDGRMLEKTIRLEDETVDTVVSTFTLCTIPGIVEAIRGIARVLKPGGTVIFFELGLSPEPKVQHRQKQLEPICHRLFQGLYLTRDIPSLILQGGFQINQMEAGYLAQFPKSLSYCWWGIAIKSAERKFSKSQML